MAMLVGAVGVVSAVVAVLPAQWWDSVLVVHADQRTDASPALVVGLWLHNFFFCACVLFVGAVAHAARAGGVARGCLVLLMVATVLQFRMALAFGVVGGLDPSWLVKAAPWWLLETAAMAIAITAMWSAWATQSRDIAARQLGVAVLQIGVVLLVASVVEVALT
jgi:hypothetical protein